MVNEDGNAYLPDPVLQPSIDDLVEELSNFSNGKHENQVGCLRPALTRLQCRLLLK